MAFIPVDPFDIVIFGVTGDLSRRKLLPALYHRFLDGQICPTCKIIGVARREKPHDEFLDMAKTACQDATTDWDEKQWEKFASQLSYVGMDPTLEETDWDPLKAKFNTDGRTRVFYLATTPLIYVALCQRLGAAGLNTPETRLVLEKPIGKDLGSAQAINEGVGAVFPENQIYRIDHYLGKETVQNLMVLRFANTLFAPLWDRNSIDHVQITAAESLGLEGRADYYDRSGAVRDMVQNHLLQLLCLTAMEPPNSLDGNAVRTEKIKVLQALKRFTNDSVLSDTVRGQYSEGVVDGEPVQSYLQTLSEEDAQSSTETFVCIKTEIENWRWKGVPFYLRTGKRLSERRSEIVIQFKSPAHNVFGQTLHSNRLVIRLQPDEGMRMFMQVKEPGPGGLRLKDLPLNLAYAENFTERYPDAYERLLMDVVRGNLSLFMRRDEVESAWEWVDNLFECWDAADQPLEDYKPGTYGPEKSAKLLIRDNRTWWEG